MLRATIRNEGVSIAMQTGGLTAELPAGKASELGVAGVVEVVALVAVRRPWRRGSADQPAASGLEAAVRGEYVECGSPQGLKTGVAPGVGARLGGAGEGGKCQEGDW